MNPVAERSGDILPLVKTMKGCLVIITGILLALAASLVFDATAHNTGLVIITAICCALTGGLFVFLYPVVSRLTPGRSQRS
jgi:hypothetical protein